MIQMLFSLLAVAPSVVTMPSDSLKRNNDVTIERMRKKLPYNDGVKLEKALHLEGATEKPLEFLFSMRPWTDVTVSAIEITVPSWTESLGFTVREKTEIEVGDSIRAVVKNPKTGENISESNEIEVQY